MAGYPDYKLDWAPIGSEGQQPRAHVVLHHFNDGPVLFGSIPLEWLKGSHASIILTDNRLCDHVPSTGG